MEDRLRYELISKNAKNGFFVRSTASTRMDRPVSPEVPPGTIAGLGQAVKEAVDAGALRIVIFTHGYNNPTDVAMKNGSALYESRFADSTETIFLAFLWPSEAGFRPKNFNFARRIPALASAIVSVGSLLALGGLALGIRESHPEISWLQIVGWLAIAIGSNLLGFIAYVWFLRFAVYYRDHYRAAEYGVPDLAETVRQLDSALGKREVPIGLSFIGHSMGAFVTTGAIRLMSDFFAPANDPGTDISLIGQAFKLENLVLVSPDIPAQAIISKRLNFLASSLRRFTGLFLFSNGADVVLDPISTTVNSPVMPLVSDKWNVRLGNIATEGLPGGISLVQDLNSYSKRLCTPHGSLTELLEEHRKKPHIELTPDTAFTIVDCTAFKDDNGHHPLSRGHVAPHLLARLWILVFYLFRKIDTHSGYFAQPSLAEVIAKTVEGGWPALKASEPWAKKHNVPIICWQQPATPPTVPTTPTSS